MVSRLDLLRRRLDAFAVAPAAAVGAAVGTAAAAALLWEPTPARVAVAVGLALLPLPIAFGARMTTEELPVRRAPPVQRPLLRLVQIPGGSFWMGSRDDDPQAFPDEKPRHRVEVAPFWIGRYVVTQAEYREVTQQSPGRPPGDDLPANSPRRPASGGRRRR